MMMTMMAASMMQIAWTPEEGEEAAELQACMDYFENNKLSLCREQDLTITKLSCAAMAIVSDEMGKV